MDQFIDTVIDKFYENNDKFETRKFEVIVLMIFQSFALKRQQKSPERNNKIEKRWGTLLA